METRDRVAQHTPVDQENNRPAMLKHVGMMAVCCGLPIALALAIPLLGFSLGSMEYWLPLLCPVLMVVMCIYMIRRHR